MNRDLWSYDQKERYGIQVFSFRGHDSLDMRNHFGQHEIQILKVENTGDMEFLVYGYQNRGNHEGRFGITGYRFQKEDNALSGRVFLSRLSVSFGQLKADLEQLVYQSSSDMLYFYLNHAI